MKKLLFVSLFVSLLALTASAYQPLAVNVPIATQLAAVTNQTLYTNVSTAFVPLQGADARLVLNLTTGQTNQITAGFNIACDPAGTNFTTTCPLQFTFVQTTNFAFTSGAQVWQAYVPGSNWTAVVKARLDYLSTTNTGATLQGMSLNYNY